MFSTVETWFVKSVNGIIKQLFGRESHKEIIFSLDNYKRLEMFIKSNCSVDFTNEHELTIMRKNIDNQTKCTFLTSVTAL